MRKLNYIFFLLIICTSVYAAWDDTEPADNRTWNTGAGVIRDNWTALEVVLGIDLSMEGSASPWYQSSAPTTTADGSTALAAANDGLLWVDSDSRALNAYIDGTGFVGIDAIPDVVTFTADDQTPTVIIGRTFKTDTGTLTITDFDNGPAGKIIWVESAGAITFDTTTAQDGDHNLDGSSADIVTASKDVTVWETSDGTTWNLVRWHDASADHTDIATVTYVDAQVGGVGATISTATVFNTTMTSAATFQDLDLSGTVGSNVALVYLEVKSSGASIYVSKQKGENGAWAVRSPSTGVGFGSTLIDFAADHFGNVTLMTDASGFIEHAYTNNSDTITIIVRGYVN